MFRIVYFNICNLEPFCNKLITIATKYHIHLEMHISRVIKSKISLEDHALKLKVTVRTKERRCLTLITFQ